MYLKSLFVSIILSLFLVGCGGGSDSSDLFITEQVSLYSPALENNLINESPTRTLCVILPADYHESTNTYPVVYFLAGYDAGNIGFTDLEGGYAAAIENGTMEDAITVVISGRNILHGSFYVNSPVTGNWEDHVVQDIVNYIDANYRTIPDKNSRAIAGHSMGGFGALNIGMKHPDVFSIVYSLSPGIFPENSMESTMIVQNTSAVNSFLNTYNSLSPLNQEAARSSYLSTINNMDYNSNWELMFMYAYGAAFAYTDKAPYCSYPYENNVPVSGVWEKWESGYGNSANKLIQYKDNINSLNGILIDYGINDEFQWIPQGCQYFEQLALENNVNVDIRSSNAGHSNLNSRIRDYMYPYIGSRLNFN